MLNNTDWQKPKVQADVFSLAGFTAWLEQQPLNTRYDWHDIFGCVVCRYLNEMCETKWPGRPNLATVFPTIEIYSNICGTRPWTFGAALARSRKAAQAS